MSLVICEWAASFVPIQGLAVRRTESTSLRRGKGFVSITSKMVTERRHAIPGKQSREFGFPQTLAHVLSVGQMSLLKLHSAHGMVGP